MASIIRPEGCGESLAAISAADSAIIGVVKADNIVCSGCNIGEVYVAVGVGDCDPADDPTELSDKAPLDSRDCEEERGDPVEPLETCCWSYACYYCYISAYC